MRLSSWPPLSWGRPAVTAAIQSSNTGAIVPVKLIEKPALYL
jgi:hypothetical protein